METLIRRLVKENKIPYVQCGSGARGKVLISKASLLNYLEGKQK